MQMSTLPLIEDTRTMATLFETAMNALTPDKEQIKVSHKTSSASTFLTPMPSRTTLETHLR
jgi:hypothetical protein